MVHEGSSSMPLDSAPVESSDLHRHAWNEYSQGGEDGILAVLFERISVETGWFVEFGAWDGIKVSNTYRLIRSQNWHGVLIEADRDRFAQLEQNLAGTPGLTCLNRMVTVAGPNSLERILAQTETPKEFDLLSIDIDGNDYHIWEKFVGYMPKVVVIEYNPTIPNDVEFVQPADPRVCQGSSLLSITTLARRKGYEIVAATTTNAIFLRSDLYPKAGVLDNSLDSVRPDRSYQTNLFQLFDGTLVLSGNTRLLWHDVEIRQAKLQVVPRPLRVYPESASRVTAILMAVWRRLYERDRRLFRGG